ncbi:MAG: hypothetical protein JWO04_2125 [Gammaproteobacteria bacterium]|jgi:hypothetical protein|nr:hypothetical protein [Gammaproteobacteria bacterium]
MKRVVLHIDQLSLRGFSHADTAVFSDGLSSGLQSLLGRGDAAVDALSQHHASHFVKAGSVRVPHGGSAGAVGRAVAGRIVRGAKS